MFRIFKKLEDYDRSFIGPNVKALKFCGLILPKNVYLKSLCYLCFISFIVFVITEYIDVWLIKNDLNMLMTNMKLTLFATVDAIKVAAFYYYQQNWNRIINYIIKANVAQRSTDNFKKIRLITKFTKYSRKITYSYWILMCITVVFLTCYPVLKYLFSSTYRHNVQNGTEPYFEVLNSWVPFDKTAFKGYVVAYIYQSISTMIAGTWITAFDTTILVTMVFFRAEFELLRIDSVDIFGTENAQVPDEIALKRLKECHKRHVELIKYANLFDDSLSLIMFLYALVCSLVLCLTAYQMTHETNVAQKILFMEYLFFAIIQLFVYCWHSNDVLYASIDLSRAPYESIWWTRSVAHRKNLCMLTNQFSKIVRFSVGPFTTLTVATFIQIVKGAYSYYTLLAKVK